jgi:hypothetical protein
MVAPSDVSDTDLLLLACILLYTVGMILPYLARPRKQRFAPYLLRERVLKASRACIPLVRSRPLWRYKAKTVYAFNIELFLTQLAELDSSDSINSSYGACSSNTNSGSTNSSSVATELEGRLYKAVRKALLAQVQYY